MSKKIQGIKLKTTFVVFKINDLYTSINIASRKMFFIRLEVRLILFSIQINKKQVVQKGTKNYTTECIGLVFYYFDG